MPRLTWRALVEKYGIDKAEELCREFGGCRFPKISAKLRERIERDRAILEELDDDVPAAEIAERHHVSKARVVQIGKLAG